MKAKKRIPVSEDVWKRLGEMKDSGQTYDDLLDDMIRVYKERNLAEMARKKREEGKFVKVDFSDIDYEGGETTAGKENLLEIEKALCEHPDIEEATVTYKESAVTSDDENGGVLGDTLSIWVIKKEDSELTENEIREFVASYIDSDKHLKVTFVDPLPETSTKDREQFDLFEDSSVQNNSE